MVMTPVVSDLHREEEKKVNGNYSCLANDPGICRSLSACSVDTTGEFITTGKIEVVFKPDYIIFMVGCITGFQHDYARTQCFSSLEMAAPEKIS